MYTKLAALLLTAAAIAPVAVSAQSFTGGVTLGYGLADFTADPSFGGFTTDLNNFTFDGRINVDFGGGWSFGARADHANIDVDVVSTEVTGDLFGFEVSYAFGGGGWVGVYGEDASIGIDLIPIEIGSTQYGIEGGYKGNGFAVSAFAGSDDDIKHIGIAGEYTGNSAFTLGGSAMRTTISVFGSEIEIEYVGLGGAYSINDKFNVFAGYGKSSIDDGELNTYGIGAGYDLSSFTKMPMVASLELARSHASFGSTDIGDIDTVRLGLTIPLGGAAASKVPLNSVADAALNPSHSAISQTILMAF